MGTIASAEDRAVNELRGLKDCVIGFFECVDDYAVAEALFDMRRGWAIAHGLGTLYGPFNLDYEDGYGVLIEGRDRPPALLCGHTPPYYQGFFERYGFQPARGDNIAFAHLLRKGGGSETPGAAGGAVTPERAYHRSVGPTWRTGTRRSTGCTCCSTRRWPT